MQVSSLGSLLNPLPNDQLIAYYNQQQQRRKTNQSQEEFLALYDTRRHLALEDAKELADLGVTAKEVAAKLSDIAQKAKPFFKGTLRAKTPLDQSYADVDGNFRVRGLDERVLTLSAEPCILCNHHATGGIEYSIQNLRTQEEVKIRAISLHVLDHDYFGSRTHPQRVDINLLCRVLEMGPYKFSGN